MDYGSIVLEIARPWVRRLLAFVHLDNKRWSDQLIYKQIRRKITNCEDSTGVMVITLDKPLPRGKLAGQYTVKKLEQ